MNLKVSLISRYSRNLVSCNLGQGPRHQEGLPRPGGGHEEVSGRHHELPLADEGVLLRRPQELHRQARRGAQEGGGKGDEGKPQEDG